MKNVSNITKRKMYCEQGTDQTGGNTKNYRLSDTCVVSVKWSSDGGNHYDFKIGEILNGNEIHWGEALSPALTTNAGGNGVYTLVPLDSTHFVFIWQDDETIRAKVGTFDLDDLTLDAVSSWGTAANYDLETNELIDGVNLAGDYVDTNKFVIGYIKYNTGTNNRYYEVCAGTVSGTTITFGSVLDSDSLGTQAGAHTDIKALTTANIILGFDIPQGGLSQIIFVGYTISGTTLTYQSVVTLGSGTGYDLDSFCKYNDTTIAIGYNFSTSYGIHAMTFDGSTCTLYTTPVTDTGTNCHITRIKDNYFLANYDDGAGAEYAEVCTLDPIIKTITRFDETKSAVTVVQKMEPVNITFGLNDYFNAVTTETSNDYVLQILTT